MFALVIRLQDIIKTSSKCFQDFFKASLRRFSRTFSKRLQDVENVFKASSRHLQDVFKTSSRHLQDVLPKLLQDVFKTFSRGLAKMSSRHLQDVKCLQEVLKTYHQVKLLFLVHLRDLFNTFLRRTVGMVNYRRICLGHTSEKNMVSVQNLQE